MRYYFGEPKLRKAPSAAIIKRLLVRCPATSRLTPTGQTIDEQLWTAARLKGGKFTCPHCHKPHSWKKSDVVLAR